MYWITDNLGVSGYWDVELDYPVTAVLNVAQERFYEVPENLPYLHRGFPDVQPFPIDTIAECVQWVAQRLEEDCKVLVHCAEGNSRSVSVAIAYLLSRGTPLDQCKKMVLEKKPFTSLGGKPIGVAQYFNDGFFDEWQKFLRARKLEGRVEAGS